MARIEIEDARAARLFPPDAALERLATGAAWSEGPVWLHEDRSVLWSDIPNDRVLRWHAGEGLRVWRDDADFANGHVRYVDGSLLYCSHGKRAIVRTRLGPRLERLGDEIVVDRFEGRRLNSPNDLVVKSDGTLWFTDPPYGIASDREGRKAASELDGNHVFRYDPATARLDIASAAIAEPNGLAFSPDESRLYVSDTSAASRPGGHHHIVVFDVADGARLQGPRLFARITPGLPDGFRVDVHGWLYTSSADSVQVYHPDGSRLARIPVPEVVGNLTFGGPRRNELYICATTSLYRIVLHTRGVQRP